MNKSSKHDHKPEEFKLYVTNLPPDFGEREVTNMFINFGNPFDVYRPPKEGRGWAFVKYGNKSEAELAIDEINNKPPWFLKVQYAHTSEERELKRREKLKDELFMSVLEADSDEDPAIPSSYFNTGFGRGRGIIPVRMPSGPSKFPDVVPAKFESALNLHDKKSSVSYIAKNHAEPGKMMGVKQPVVMGRGYRRTNPQEHSSGRGSVEMLCNDLETASISSYASSSVKNTEYDSDYKKVIESNSGKKCGFKESSARDQKNLGTCKNYTHNDGNNYNNKGSGKPNEDVKSRDDTSNFKRRTSVNERLKIKQSGSINAQCLPKEMYTKVKVTVPIGEMEYWVQMVNSKEKLVKVMTLLNDGTEASPVQSPQLDLMCAAMYDGYWHRGKLTSVTPELKVHYIDFGNEERCSLNQLRSLSEKVRDVPAMAIRIKLADGTSGKYRALVESEVISVKPVDESGDATIVYVEGEIYEERQNQLKFSPCTSKLAKSKRRSKALQSVVYGLSVGTRGGGQFRQWLPDGDFGVTIVYSEVMDEFNRLFDTLLKTFKNSSSSETHKANVGETVAAFVHVGGNSRENETWMRARVLSVGNDSYQINFCDMGQLATVKSVYKLPKELSLIPEFGARCSVVGNVKKKVQDWFMEQRRFKFTVISVDEISNTVVCMLHTDTEQEVGKAILKPWVPTRKVKECESIGLKSNDRVVISSFIDQKVLYVHPRSVVSKIQEDVNHQCTTSDVLDHVPDKDEIVGCRDGTSASYYRAKVLDSKNEEKIKVIYIDFGKLDCVERERLKPLPANLKIIPAMAVKINLMNVIDKPMNKSATDLINHMMSSGIELRLFHPQSTTECVKLFLPDGRNLNHELNKCLKRSSGSHSSEPKTNSVKDKHSSANKMSSETSTTGLKKMSREGSSSGKNLDEESRKSGAPEKISAVKGITDSSQPVAVLDLCKSLPDKKSNESKIYTEEDIKYRELPIGKTIDFVVLHKMDSFTFMGCEADPEKIAYIHNVMSADMNKYCESTAAQLYEPKIGELCFAKFEDGLWYRAMCISIIPSENNIIFLDFGNVASVENANIRRMTEEYLKTPALAVMCCLKGYSEGKFSKTEMKQVDELVEINKVYKAEVISCEGLGTYMVEFPHVTTAFAR